jgi:hypothetical protein
MFLLVQGGYHHHLIEGCEIFEDTKGLSYQKERQWSKQKRTKVQNITEKRLSNTNTTMKIKTGVNLMFLHH